MNVSRRMANGLVNQYEPFNTQVIYATSAGTKSSFGYEALIDTFEKAIVTPHEAFAIGLDYRIPVLHGLVDRKYVQNLKLSASYNESTFAAELIFPIAQLKFLKLLGSAVESIILQHNLKR